METPVTTTAELPIAVNAARLVARPLLAALGHVGRLGMMMLELFRALPEWRAWLPRTLEQCQNVGYGSLFIVVLTAAFSGAVASLQAGYQFTGSIPVYLLGAVISESIILELGPVMTGLLLAGRIGARYAAELGTMRVTEQVDALESLGRNPASHLLLPRVLAGMVMVPGPRGRGGRDGDPRRVGWWPGRPSTSPTRTSCTAPSGSSAPSTSGTR